MTYTTCRYTTNVMKHAWCDSVYVFILSLYHRHSDIHDTNLQK